MKSNGKKNTILERRVQRSLRSARPRYRRPRAYDGRTREALRWKALYKGFLAQTSTKQDLLCRQAATLVLQREVLDVKLARGEDVNVDLLVRLSGAISRTLERLGIVPKLAAKQPTTLDRVLSALKEAHPT